MKNVHARQMDWGCASWRWSRDSLAVRLSASRATPVRDVLEPASGSDSRNCKFSQLLGDPWADPALTRPTAVRHPQLFMFPGRKAPRVDGEAGGSLGAPLSSGLLGAAHVLLVEDDFILAYELQTLLEEQGAHVIGPASSLAEARAMLASATPNVAVLDVNLNGELVFPIIEDLRSRHVPFVFATAYADDDRLYPVSTKDIPRLAKPVMPNVLIGHIARLLK
jgi:two-component system, response regulator PdtaR